MKKTLQRLGMVTVGLSLCLWSCDKQDKIVQPSEEITVLTPTEYNSRLEDMGKALAISMNEKSVRSFIKEEALKRFDGDYDILYGQIESKKINGENFESILATNTNAGKNAKVDAVNNLRLTQKLIPLLNIAVPVNIDKWNTDNFSPLVVVLQDDYDDQKTKTLKAFKADGSSIIIDATKAPSEPVIVISENERALFEKGAYTVRSDIYGGTFSQNSGLSEIKPISKANKGAKVASTLGYNLNQYLYLQSLFCYDVSVYESWWKGGPEIEMRVFGAFFGANSLTQFRDTGEMWFPRNFPLYTGDISTSIIYWNSSIQDGMKFWFAEIDGGALKKVTIGATYTISGVGTSLGFEFDTGEADDIIGEYFVDRNAYAPYSLAGYQCYDVSSNFYFALR
jgi:hypothetical protein